MSVTVNGVMISGGKSVSVINGRVVVDGNDVTPENKQITISVQGNVERLSVDACEKVSVSGDVGNVKTLSGDVDITGNVNGSVQTMSGDVDCGGNISGAVSTISGNIKHKK